MRKKVCLLETVLLSNNMVVEIGLRFFPFLDDGHVMCDPWESAQLVHFMEHNIPTDQCNYCLPDCSRTIYQYTASAQPFR